VRRADRLGIHLHHRRRDQLFLVAHVLPIVAASSVQFGGGLMIAALSAMWGSWAQHLTAEASSTIRCSSTHRSSCRASSRIMIVLNVFGFRAALSGSLADSLRSAGAARAGFDRDCRPAVVEPARHDSPPSGLATTDAQERILTSITPRKRSLA
jgi:hypothetical protein